MKSSRQCIASPSLVVSLGVWALSLKFVRRTTIGITAQFD